MIHMATNKETSYLYNLESLVLSCLLSIRCLYSGCWSHLLFVSSPVNQLVVLSQQSRLLLLRMSLKYPSKECAVVRKRSAHEEWVRNADKIGDTAYSSIMSRHIIRDRREAHDLVISRLEQLLYRYQSVSRRRFWLLLGLITWKACVLKL